MFESRGVIGESMCFLIPSLSPDIDCFGEFGDYRTPIVVFQACLKLFRFADWESQDR